MARKPAAPKAEKTFADIDPAVMYRVKVLRPFRMSETDVVTLQHTNVHLSGKRILTLESGTVEVLGVRGEE